MVVHLTARAKIPPTPELIDAGMVCTKIWNKANYYCRELWQKTGKIPSCYELQRIFKDDRWCRQVHSHTAQAVLHKLSEAYRSWFTLRKVDATANLVIQEEGQREHYYIQSLLSAWIMRGCTYRCGKTNSSTFLKGKPSANITQGYLVRLEIRDDTANIVYHVDEPPLQNAGHGPRSGSDQFNRNLKGRL